MRPVPRYSTLYKEGPFSLTDFLSRRKAILVRSLRLQVPLPVRLQTSPKERPLQGRETTHEAAESGWSS